MVNAAKRFFLPRPAILDPVLTSNEDLLRLEGFSGCCGVYARVDLPAEAFDGDCHGRGTTNVDFNQPMRNALLRLRDNEEVRFEVGANEVVLSKGNEKTVEKKVKLPLRWIKGFSEVQAYQPRLQVMMEVSAAVVRNAGEEDVVVAALDDVVRVDLHVAEMANGCRRRLRAGAERRFRVEALGGEPDAARIRYGKDDRGGWSAWHRGRRSGRNRRVRGLES